MDSEAKIEQLLNDALAEYSAVEPRAGLELRVLAHLHSQPARRRWWILLAVPALAVLLVVLTLWPRSKPAPQTFAKTVPATIEAPKTFSPPSVSPQPAVRRTPTSRQRVPVLRAASAPRLQTFPAPAPMSEQERLLLAFVRQNQNEAQVVATEQEQRDAETTAFFNRGEQ